MEKENYCCKKDGRNGLLKGLMLGVLPHSFCIGFIVFSAIGATFFASIFKKLLISTHFFHILIALSLIIATISALGYLRINRCLCLVGIRKKWKYISTLYLATIIANLLMFFVIFPLLSNLGSNKAMANNENLIVFSMKVNIPCPDMLCL